MFLPNPVVCLSLVYPKASSEYLRQNSLFLLIILCSAKIYKDIALGRIKTMKGIGIGTHRISRGWVACLFAVALIYATRYYNYAFGDDHG